MTAKIVLASLSDLRKFSRQGLGFLLFLGGLIELAQGAATLLLLESTHAVAAIPEEDASAC